MSTGLFALLKDVSLIAKTAAASLDDIATASLKATSKSVGLVIDDAAVTPKYVVGFSAEREIPIIRAIAIGSLKNKFYYILPIAIILGFFAPWLIHPILLLGGLYLSYEGAEKILSVILGKGRLLLSRRECLFLRTLANDNRRNQLCQPSAEYILLYLLNTLQKNAYQSVEPILPFQVAPLHL